MRPGLDPKRPGCGAVPFSAECNCCFAPLLDAKDEVIICLVDVDDPETMAFWVTGVLFEHGVYNLAPLVVGDAVAECIIDEEYIGGHCEGSILLELSIYSGGGFCSLKLYHSYHLML